MQSNYVVLEIQKKVVSIFMELQEETNRLDKLVSIHGWAQRDALISHVYSGYNKHEELIQKKERWENTCFLYRVHSKLSEYLIEYRDLYGYFPEYEKMMYEFKGLLDLAIKKEEYEIAAILQSWYDKFPIALKSNPRKLFTQICES
jgi:hypothetical protein